MSQHIFTSSQLPADYAYLQGVVEKYTLRSGSDSDYDNFISSLSNTQILEIAEAYLVMLNKNDVTGFTLCVNEQEQAFKRAWRIWCHLQEERETSGLEPLADNSAPLKPKGRELFKLFGSLYRHRISPFDRKILEYVPPPIVLDWSKLPIQLAYLQAPAMRYGVIQFDQDRKHFLRQITTAQRNEISSLAKRVRTPHDSNLFYEWYQAQLRTEKHPEADLIYWLMAIINGLIPEIA